MSNITESAEPVRTVHQSGLSSSRILDLAVALMGAVVLSPVVVLIALAILIETGRPVFFSQVRLGLNGRHFRIWKFRKFHKDSSPTGLPLTMKNDSRMTRLGGFLARTKLDELPQFWNVIKGDMSLVGPRPETIDFADCFTDTYRSVLDYKPGIFGPSQTLFRNESGQYLPDSDPIRFYRDVLFPQKALNDLSYYPYRTITSDIGWIASGVLAIMGWRLLPIKSMGQAGKG